MRLTALIFALGLGLFPACDSGTNGGGGPSTMCDLNFVLGNEALKGFGQGCDSDAECQFSECVMPGTPGNITNTSFGFCSRGCDCEDSVDSRLPVDEKEILLCLYPAGFKSFHHVTVKCNNVSDCKALDERWTDCREPDTGGARKVCHATN